ncbi:hypothetical protein IEQ34_000292 [Dendrobium chrysotoxum]|uniref:HNH homing endonuclease n=1 Tax=Dendrobium chrysotoxum TaxID=161865 RepID=A0AAV7HS00_DENCH|nr:hypothetical protein IEQ34_000292 [Dendrobium chrysotoxum]
MHKMITIVRNDPAIVQDDLEILFWNQSHSHIGTIRAQKSLIKNVVKVKTHACNMLTKEWLALEDRNLEANELVFKKLHLHAIADHSLLRHHPSLPCHSFSTGDYNGKVFHEFNDSIIPLYLTAHHHILDKKNRERIVVACEQRRRRGRRGYLPLSLDDLHAYLLARSPLVGGEKT